MFSRTVPHYSRALKPHHNYSITTVQRHQNAVAVLQYLNFITCLGPAAVALVTWLASVAMVDRVVMGVATEAVTVPRLDTPAETDRLMTSAHSRWITAWGGVWSVLTCSSLDDQGGDGGFGRTR